MEKVPLKKNASFLLLGCLVAALASILIPNLIRAQESNPPLETGTAALLQIERQLKLLEIAKEQWAYENKKATTDSVAIYDLTAYMPRHTLENVASATISLTTVGSPAVMSLSGGSLNGKTGPFTVTSF